MLQVGIYIIIAIQILTLAAIVVLTRVVISRSRRPVREASANIEANRYRAEHPELWKWEPEQGQGQPPTRPEGE